jgi:hypothetical protein
MFDHLKPVDVADIRVAGALDTDATADGIVFRRLPASTRHQITDIQLHLMVTMPAGVRFELVTDATTIEFDVLLTRLELNRRPPKPAVFDLVVDGTVVASRESTAGNRILYDAFTGHVDFAFGEPTTIRLAGYRDSPELRQKSWPPDATPATLTCTSSTDWSSSEPTTPAPSTTASTRPPTATGRSASGSIRWCSTARARFERATRHDPPNDRGAAGRDDDAPTRGTPPGRTLGASPRSFNRHRVNDASGAGRVDCSRKFE